VQSKSSPRLLSVAKPITFAEAYLCRAAARNNVLPKNLMSKMQRRKEKLDAYWRAANYRLYESHGVREASWISLTGCHPNRVQPRSPQIGHSVYRNARLVPLRDGTQASFFDLDLLKK
jgi:hypothetical protein